MGLPNEWRSDRALPAPHTPDRSPAIHRARWRVQGTMDPPDTETSQLGFRLSEALVLVPLVLPSLHILLE